MALLLSSIVVVLVSTTFLVQNQYYASQTLHVGAHDNARAMTERMSGEVRTAMDEGFVVAGKKTLTVRSPIVTAAVCDRTGNLVAVHTEGGEAALDTAEVAGVGWLDPITGVWDLRTATWSYVNGSGAPAAGVQCGMNGSDTTWATSEYHRLRRFNLLYGSVPDAGDVVMLYRETTFQISPSVLDPGTLGLFRQVYGASAVEFATGMDTTAQFQYRTGGSTYADTIFGSALADIDAVRIVADARKRPATGGQEPVTFGWSINVAIRSAQ